jgi:hypothetical protein
MIHNIIKSLQVFFGNLLSEASRHLHCSAFGAVQVRCRSVVPAEEGGLSKSLDNKGV